MRNLNTLDKYRLVRKEIEIYGVRGDEGNGCFEVKIGAKWFFVIASNGGGWEHVSVSPSRGKNIPTWNEMCKIKEMFFEDEEEAIQIHPKKSEYIMAYPYCQHLWRPTDGELVKPPREFV